MALNVRGHMDALTSLAGRSGLFSSVTGYEMKSPPDSALSCNVILGAINPITSSGLTHVSVRIEYQMRILNNMLQEPQESIDPDLADATDWLMTELAIGHTLDRTVREVDIFGEAGEPLRAVPGYMQLGQTMYRVMDVFVPLLINDAWELGE
jgi:hypothetical protein